MPDCRRTVRVRADQPENGGGCDHCLPTLRQALASAMSGDTILLSPGRYVDKIRLCRVAGDARAPVVIQGMGRRTILDGGANPYRDMELRNSLWARESAFRVKREALAGASRPFFTLDKCAWIEWRGLWVENCWPHFLRGSECRYLTVADCDVTGGKYAFFFDDQGKAAPSHHLLFEDNRWCQDPTGPVDPGLSDPAARESWTDWTWHEMKKGAGAFDGARDLTFMNGGFLGAADIAGGVIIRRNQLRFAFNAIRMEVTEKAPRRRFPHRYMTPETPDLGENKFNLEAPDLSRNANVEIYENVIEYIRDNAIEPEYGAVNWWVWNNDLRNVHKAMSIHNVGGGYWYFFGNGMITDAVPPAQVKEPRERWKDGKPRKLGGKVFKFNFGPPLPDRPVYIMHNSWRVRGGVLTGGGEMRGLHHFNNAAEHCPDTPDGQTLWCSPEPRFTELYDPEHQPDKAFRYTGGSLTPPVPTDRPNQFDHDVSNGVDFPSEARAQGQEANGVQSAGPIFQGGGVAPLALAAESAARGLARALCMEAVADWPADFDWTSNARDAGMLQPEGRFGGPPFAHCHSPHYAEGPRLVKADGRGDRIELWFSTPLNPASENVRVRDAVAIAVDGDEAIGADLSVSGACLTVTLARPMCAPLAGIRLPAGLTGSDGACPSVSAEASGSVGRPSNRSRPITCWGSVIPLWILEAR